MWYLLEKGFFPKLQQPHNKKARIQSEVVGTITRGGKTKRFYIVTPIYYQPRTATSIFVQPITAVLSSKTENNPKQNYLKAKAKELICKLI
jgi:hypothetical protein